MTETRDFDRLARAWLDLMPDEAPDRVIEAVLQAVDVTPQRRTPFEPALRRFFPMNRLTYAAVALAIVVLGGGALLLTQFHPSTVGPSQGPTATPTPSATLGVGAAIPQALQGDWFGGPRTLAGLTGGAGTELRVDQSNVRIVQSNQVGRALLGSTGSIVDGRLQVQWGSGPNVCGAAQVGSYAYSLSGSGETLTLSDPRDTCAVRQSTLAGTWWRMDCKGADQPGDAPACLGLMDAGTYGSQYWIPTLANGQLDWAPRYGGLTFTVPDGWTNYADFPDWFGLTLSTEYGPLAAGADPADRIQLVTNAMAESQDRPCSNAPAAGVGRSSAAIAQWLQTLGSLQFTKPTSITVGGKTGLVMDIVVPKAPKQLCGGVDPIVEFLISQPWNRPPSQADVHTDGFLIGAKQRLILLDSGSGPTTAIVIHSSDASQFDAFASQAMPIIDSFQFK